MRLVRGVDGAGARLKTSTAIFMVFTFNEAALFVRLDFLSVIRRSLVWVADFVRRLDHKCIDEDKVVDRVWSYANATSVVLNREQLSLMGRLPQVSSSHGFSKFP